MPATNFEVGGITIPYVRLWVFITTVVLSVLFLLLLERTKLGRAIRATSEELRAARLTGIPVAHIYAVTFGLGAALAGAAGGLWGMLFPITPIMGGGLTLKSFVVAVLGGLGTMMGAIIGGLVLGVAESITSTYLGPHVSERGELRPPRADPDIPPDRPAGKTGLAVGARWTPVVVGALAVLVLAMAPAILSPFLVQFLINLFMLAALAESWNIIGGFTGYASFGNVAFFGIGAYTTGVLLTVAELPFALALPAAGHRRR